MRRVHRSGDVAVYQGQARPTLTGDPMPTKYTTRGSIRGTCGHAHRSIRTAERCRRSDNIACHPGYSDRWVVRVDGEDLSDTEIDELNQWTDAPWGER